MKTLECFLKILKFNEKKYRDNQKGCCFIDSSDVEDVSASALMYLIAIIVDAKNDNYILRGNFPQNKEAGLIFKRYGFMKFVNTKTAQIIPKDDEIQIITGVDVDPKVAEEVIIFARKYCIEEDLKALYGTLIELMSNARQHAYGTNKKTNRNWFVFAEKKQDLVEVIFLDTGMGIPKTVQTNYQEKLTFKVLTDDSRFIESALKGEFRTQTKEKNRGQGLPQIDKYFKSLCVQEALIISGKGVCRLSSDEGDYVLTVNEKELTGTLYSWKLRVEVHRHD